MYHSRNLIEAYQRLYQSFGPQFWWPGETPFEVIIGAILTQNTNWLNVEKALLNLKTAKVLSPQHLRGIPSERLAQLIRPAGYFNVKAKRLKNFIRFLFDEYDGSLLKMGKEDLGILRQKLLLVNGIGPETADSILLYAFHKPIFVIDAYTKRFLTRHRLIEGHEEYHQVQGLFMERLKEDAAMFNEYHALIVRLGKDFCRPKPLCETCPLNDWQYSFNNKCPDCHRWLQKNKCDVCA
jgi:endonuclease-3 related protein